MNKEKLRKLKELLDLDRITYEDAMNLLLDILIEST